jgi:hypothetical protein
VQPLQGSRLTACCDSGLLLSAESLALSIFNGIIFTPI